MSARESKRLSIYRPRESRNLKPRNPQLICFLVYTAAGQGGERLFNAGLGFSAAANVSISHPGLDDVYDSYRRMRSGHYKDVMAKSQAAQAQLVKGGA